MANTLVAKTSLSFYKDECHRYAFDSTVPVSSYKKFIDAATLDMLGLVKDLNESTMFNKQFLMYTESLIQVIKESKRVSANEQSRDVYLSMLSKVDLAADIALNVLPDINRVSRFEAAETTLRKLVVSQSWKVSKMYESLGTPLINFFSELSHLKVSGIINIPYVVADFGTPDGKTNQIKISKDMLLDLYQLAITTANGYDTMKADNMEDYEELMSLVNKYTSNEANCSTCTCVTCPNYPNKFPPLEDDEEDEPVTGCPQCPGHYHYEGDPQCNHGLHHIQCKPSTGTTKPSTPSTSTSSSCCCTPTVKPKPPIVEDDDDDNSGLGSFSCTTKK